MPDLAAPGSKITMETAEGMVTLSGTSMAAPVVFSLALILRSEEPGLAADDVRERLVETAAPIEQAGETEVGVGMVDLEAALADDRSGDGQSTVQNSEADQRDAYNRALSTNWRGFRAMFGRSL